MKDRTTSLPALCRIITIEILWCFDVRGHTLLNELDLVPSQKLSRVWSDYYFDGRFYGALKMFVTSHGGTTT